MSQEGQAAAAPLAGRTAWARNLPTPLREFLRTETGGAVVLLAATLAALAWANLHASSTWASYATGGGFTVALLISTLALRRQTGAARVAEDVDSADLSGVSGTPTFFVNERRHYGAYDIATLSAAVTTARKRAAVSA